MCLNFCTKFQVSRIVLTSFRQRESGGNPPPPCPTSKQAPKTPTQIKVEMCKIYSKILEKLVENIKS